MADPTMPEDGAARTAAPRNARSTLTLSRIAAFTAAIGLAGAAAWYFSPLGHEFRFAHSDLISLDSEAANHPDDGLAWYYLGLRMEEKGDPGGAVGALQQAQTLRPADPRVLVALGRALLDSNHVDLAFNVLKAAEGQDGGGTGARKLLARLYQRSGAYHKATACLEQVVKRNPDDAEAWRSLGLCYLQMQQVEQADQAARRALKLQPRDEDILRLNGSVAAARGEMDTARSRFEESVRYHPTDPRAYNDLANFLLSQARSPDDARRAEAAVSELERLEPEHPLLPWHRARLAALRQDWPEAIRLLRQTLATTPSLDEAYFALANAFYHTGQTKAGDAAMATFRRRSELTRHMDEIQIRLSIAESADLYFELARLRREAGRLDQAREAAKNGLRLAPSSPAGLAELKRIEQAETQPNRSGG